MPYKDREKYLASQRRYSKLRAGTAKQSWSKMKDRVLNPNHVKYRLYGGRGIAICDRWMNFDNFLSDMGERPAGKSLDRIDSDGNYTPDNCKWSTPTEQQHGRRDRRENRL